MMLIPLVHNRVSPYFQNMYHKLTYRKSHGCETVLLRLIEQWRNELDNHKIIRMFSMDCQRLLTLYLMISLCLSKLRAYGADDGTVDLIRDYLTDRKQRVKMGEVCSSWESICKGIPQGSVFGAVIVQYIHERSSLCNKRHHSCCKCGRYANILRWR